jgi:hypothetical protein
VSDNFGVDVSALPSERADLMPFIYELGEFYHYWELRSPTRINWRFVQSTRHSSVLGERTSSMSGESERWIIIDIAGVELTGVLLGALAAWDRDDANVLARWVLATYAQRLAPGRFESLRAAADFADSALEPFQFTAETSREVRQGASEIREEFRRPTSNKGPGQLNTDSPGFLHYMLDAAFGMAMHVVLGHELGHHVYKTEQTSPMMRTVSEFSKKFSEDQKKSDSGREEIFCDVIAAENCFHQAKRAGMPLSIPSYIILAFDHINMLIGVQNASKDSSREDSRHSACFSYLLAQAKDGQHSGIVDMIVGLTGAIVLCDGFIRVMTLRARALASKLLSAQPSNQGH